MPKITVITPSIRPWGVKTVKACLEEQTFKDFEHIIKLSDPSKGCDLCKSLNQALREAKGEYIVVWQDYISAPENTLEELLKSAEGGLFVTAAMGTTLDWKIIKWDWRHYRQGFQEIEYQHWEMDLAIAPKKAFFEVGGFDEEYDEHWSNENVNLAFRVMKLGYRFFVQPSVKGIQYAHDKVEKHPFREKYNPDFHAYRIRKIDMSEYPLKLNYLK